MYTGSAVGGAASCGARDFEEHDEGDGHRSSCGLVQVARGAVSPPQVVALSMQDQDGVYTGASATAECAAGAVVGCGVGVKGLYSGSGNATVGDAVGVALLTSAWDLWGAGSGSAGSLETAVPFAEQAGMEHELSAGVLKVLLEGAAVDQMGGVVPGCHTGTLAFVVLVV